MGELTCGIHALDSVLNTDCVHCLGIRLAARDCKIERLRKAITCLYIAADKSVADDVKTHAEAVIGEVKYLRDEQSKSAAAYGYAIKEIERLREENRRLVEELDEAEARAVRVGIKRR